MLHSPNDEMNKVLQQDRCHLYTEKGLAHTKGATSPRDQFMKLVKGWTHTKTKLHGSFVPPHGAHKTIRRLKSMSMSHR